MFNGYVFFVIVEVILLMVRLFTYGGGPSAKKTKPNLLDGGTTSKKTKPNLYRKQKTNGIATRSKKDQTELQL